MPGFFVKKEGKMRRLNRRISRKTKRVHKRHPNFLQAIRLYLEMPA